MKLNLKNWQKVDHNSTHTTMRNPEGHEVRIAHGSLSPKFRGELAALPMAPKKMANGGKVDDMSSLDDQKSLLSKEDSDQDLVDSIKDPDLKRKMMRESLPSYAEGSDNVSSDDSAPQTHAPVTINIGQPAQIPAALANPNPGSAAANNQPQKMTPVQQGYADPGSLPAGITPDALAEMTSEANARGPQSALGEASQVPSVIPNQNDGKGSPQASGDAQVAPPQGSDQNAPNGNVAVPDVIGAYAQGLEGIKQKAAAEGDLGDTQASILANRVKKEQQAMDETHASYQNLLGEQGKILQDIQSQHINPNQFWENKEAGAKVATGIGLILGGIGSGVNGGPNQALEFLNRNIDRDIESQRANIGKSQNLLTANLHQFGNLRDATELTRLQMQGITMHQLEQAAAKSQNPLAIARAQKEMADWQSQAAPQFQRLATRQALMTHGTAANDLYQQDPAKYVRFIADEKDQPGLYKEIGEAQSTTKAARNIMSAFDQVSKLQTLGGRIGSPIQSKNQIAALTGPITAGLSKETAGRFTEQDAHYLSTLWPTLSDNANTTALKKAAIQKLVTEKMNFPMLKAYDLDPEKFQSTAGGAENTPAPEIKMRNGIPYRQVGNQMIRVK